MHANPLAPQRPAPRYIIVFTMTPPDLAFILTKRPVFDSKERALQLLEHYMDEFDVQGYVTETTRGH
jgi:hypothetical protein